MGLSCYGASVFVWLVLLTLRLNGTAPGLPWFVVFAPLVLQAALFALSVMTGAARGNALPQVLLCVISPPSLARPAHLDLRQLHDVCEHVP